MQKIAPTIIQPITGAGKQDVDMQSHSHARAFAVHFLAFASQLSNILMWVHIKGRPG